MLIKSFSADVQSNRMIALLLGAFRSPRLHVLLVLDALLIVTHVLVASSPEESVNAWARFLRIDRERSLSKWIESVQLFAAFLLLTRHAQSLKRQVYLMVAGLIAFMLLDNLLELQVIFAPWLAPEQQDSAEFVMVAALATVLAAWALISYCRAGEFERAELGAMLIVLAIFTLFAVLIDFLHERIAAPGSAIYASLSVVEDGGELVTLSLLLAVVVQITRPASIAKK